MQFAKRVDHQQRDFLEHLSDALDRLLAVRGRAGILIRLHALGDFFSEAYVGFWNSMLLKHDRLALYGYTARMGDPIGRAVAQMNIRHGRRCMIRFSNDGMGSMSTVSIGSPESCPPNAFICPEQTGKTRCCATCGACWGTARNVAFLEH